MIVRVPLSSKTTIALPRNDVHDAADGIGTEGRRRAARQHVDAVDKRDRQRVEIDRGVGTETAARETPAIEQHKRWQVVQAMRTDPSPDVPRPRGSTKPSPTLTLALSGEPAVMGKDCRTSPIELSPPRSMSRRSSTVTGAMAWRGSSHQRKPVMITSSSGTSGEGGPDGRSAARTAVPTDGPAQLDGKAQCDPAKILTVRSFRNSKCSPVPASRRWSASAAGRPRGARFETRLPRSRRRR